MPVRPPMDPAPVEVVPAPWPTYREALRAVREAVFVVEQKVPRELEWDGQDDSATHVIALTDAGAAVGCARLLPTGQIGRMAVLPAYRRGGVGGRLLRAAIDEARRQGMVRLFLHAQTHALGFYDDAGFVASGETFMEAGIPHREMTLTLWPDGTVRGEVVCADLLTSCLELPRRRLAIHSQQLDPALFDRAPVGDAISRFARSAPTSRVQILINDSSRIVGRAHRLVALSRRLPSRIEIRRVPAVLQLAEPTFAVWDETGYFLLPDHREYAAVHATHEPVRATRLHEQFANLWERSATNPELRQLTL